VSVVQYIRRVLVGLLIVAVGLPLAACGSSEGPPRGTSSSSASSGTADGYPFDTSDEGDDLLAPEVRRFEFDREAPLSWRLPAFYAAGETDETSTTLKVGDVRYGIQVTAGTSTSPRAAAEQFAERLGDDVGDVVHDVKLGGRDWVAVVSDARTISHVVLYGALPGGVVIGAGLSATQPLDDVPPKRVAELHQTLLSIQLDPAPAS
jgi:hypothetical protein